MGIESIAAVSAIVIAIFLAIVVLVWQGNRSDARFDRIDAKFDRIDAKFDGIDAKFDAFRVEMRDEFRSLRESLESRLDLDSRLRSVEQEQAEARGRTQEPRESEGAAD